VEATPRVTSPDKPVSAQTRSAAAAFSDAAGTVFLHQCWANSVAHPITEAAMEYQKLITDLCTKDPWHFSAANKFGCLTKGVGRHIKETNTNKWIPCAKLLADQQPTYTGFACTIWEQKEDVLHMNDIGRNLVDYPGNVIVATSELETIKILLNSII
jgi:hypothetical protein